MEHEINTDTKAHGMEYWLRQLPERKQFENHLHPEHVRKKTRFRSMTEFISTASIQWQAMPGGFEYWRDVFNRYAPPGKKMTRITMPDDAGPSEFAAHARYLPAFFSFAKSVKRASALMILIAVMACGKKEEIKQSVSVYEIAVWELIRREGIELKPYVCPAGYKTVGVGQRTTSDKAITMQEARQMLCDDIQKRYNEVERLLPGHSRNEIMAVVLLSHNIGLSRLRKSDHWNRIVNRTPDLDSMWLRYSYYKQGGKWVKSNNLEAARRLEVDMFRNPAGLADIRDSLMIIAQNKYK